MIDSVDRFKQFSSVKNVNNIQITPVQKPQTTFSGAVFDDLTINNEKNIFLKEYLNIRMNKEKISLPEDWEIEISSPEKLSKKDNKLLRDVRVNTYKARVDDLFKLLEQPKALVDNKINEMKISDKEKENLSTLKQKYDNYYIIELKAGDKKYNLLNLSDSDKDELKAQNPQFVSFIDNEKEKLEAVTKQFSSAEIKKEVLAESGKSSRYGAYALIPVLLVTIGQAVLEKRVDAKALKANPEEFLQKQIKILEEGNPIKNFFGKDGLKNYITQIKDGENNWWRVMALAFSGSWDDCLGSVKDFFQDQDNFGTKKASFIAIPSMVMGVLTSVIISPLISSMIDYSRAKAHVAKHAPELAVKSNNKTKALFILGNTIAGVLFSVFASGSSWTSEALTFLQLKNNKKALKNNNIITSEEEKKSSTMDNFMSYEAYSGKLNGILKADPISGAGFGSLGLMTSSNPFVNAIAISVCGCIETITASIKQLTMDGERKRGIDKDKEILLNSIK